MGFAHKASYHSKGTKEGYVHTTARKGTRVHKVPYRVIAHKDSDIINFFFPSGGLLYEKMYSPRVSSAMLLRSPNLAAITSQAKIEGWCIEPHEIELHEQVGRGSTADIYRGSWKGLGVAVKCINPDFFHFNENGATFFAQEVETLSRQHHPFVLRLVGASLNPPQYGWVVTEFLRTYIYMAPEVIRCEPYTEKCDVFSYGVILNELMTGQHPYIETDYSPTEIALEVAEGNLRPALPEDNAQLGEIIELICHSWDGEMSRRPSFAIITSTLKSIQERFTTVPKSFSGIYCETWDI
ncbi:hypothetical protein IFM89_036396 [Coptis chinensis]|uniref:Protein kinase domain-containing protein n=1 Tax=Coptis chinensis TaxID=261450 RepID=A0A835IEG1_9MAGN|nr:hypothetical protein IFM89_036396 [Coptis chinensis]